MTLPETFEAVRPSIVAFIAKTVRGSSESQPVFPPVFGTGFLVDPRGIVLTNRHVAEVFKELPPHPMGGSAAAALVFLPIETEDGFHTMGAIFADIKEHWILSEFSSKHAWYGEDNPDFAFVQLNVTDTPHLPISAEPGLLKAGLGIATAGFSLEAIAQ